MTTQPESFWALHPEMVDLLKKRIREGVAYSQIAYEMFRNTSIEISRNALIGKAGRLGLINTRPPKPKYIVPRPTKVSLKPAKLLYKAPRKYIKEKPVNEPTDYLTHLLNLAEGQCRWVVGDPINLMFCGCAFSKSDTGGLSFCPYHFTLARGTGYSRGFNPTFKSGRWS